MTGRRHSLVGRSGGVLRLLGLWTPPAQRASVRGACALLRCALSFFLMASMPVAAFSRLYMDTPDDLEELSTCIFVIMASIALLIKSGCFVAQQGSVHRLLRMVVAVRAAHGEGAAAGGGGGGTRAAYRRRADAVFLYMQGMTAVALCGWVCAPLASQLFSSGGALNATLAPSPAPAALKTPLPTWAPAAAQRWPAYQALYLFETLCLTASSQALLCLDVFFIDLILLVAAELQVLNDNLAAVAASESCEELPASESALSTVQRRRQRFSDTFVASEVSVDQRMSEDMYRQLVGNIRHHQMIIECVEVLQMTMNYSIFALLFFNMTSICLNIFVTASLLQSDADLVTALKAVFTTPVFLYESAMYCIFGQMIIDQSERLPLSAFSCGWTDADTKLQRALLVLMMRSSQPLRIQVGKTYELSKETFVRVLNGSYSLFNLLYTFQGKK